jgi:3-methyladenine DNA glycosylase/8-oxoguanine DNA glycosylase
MNQILTHRMAAKPGASDWMQDRLTEARAILVDAPTHPASLVILAARVIAGQSDSASECANAVDLLCQLDRRPLHAVAAAAFPNAGAA